MDVRTDAYLHSALELGNSYGLQNILSCFEQLSIMPHSQIFTAFGTRPSDVRYYSHNIEKKCRKSKRNQIFACDSSFSMQESKPVLRYSNIKQHKSGTYGVVFSAIHGMTGQSVALKRQKLDEKEGVSYRFNRI